MELIEEICSSLESKKYTIGVFIDLRKAFDTLNHDILLSKLNHYGVRGVALDWFKSYLTNRKQYVQIGDKCSTFMDIMCGVPQGSILGPKLFIMYINDLCDVTNILKFILFADDTNAFRSGYDLTTLAMEVSLELDKLQIWFNVNKLSLNIQKTIFMIFGKFKNVQSNISIYINGYEIQQVFNTKFLGVIIDSNLN